MYVAYKRGEDPAPKKVTRKKTAKQLHEEQVQEMAEYLMEKWRRRDRLKAMKKYGLPGKS